MAEKEMKKKIEKHQDIINGMQSNMKANQEHHFFKRAEQEKKDMIANILKTGFKEPQEKKNIAADLTALSELDKINLNNQLEMDNRLRDFTNKTHVSYGSYEENVLQPTQEKRIIEQITTDQQLKNQLTEFDKKEML